MGDGSRTAFIRIGNESVPAGAVDLKRLVSRGSNKTYDSLISQYPYEKYAFTKLRSVYRQRTGKELSEVDFISFGLMDDEGMLTNAGALLADESPMRHSQIFCTRWNGLAKAHDLNIYKYLCYLLERLPGTKMNDDALSKLAPWNSDVIAGCSGAM